jgi:hypothetical protein
MDSCKFVLLKSTLDHKANQLAVAIDDRYNVDPNGCRAWQTTIKG